MEAENPSDYDPSELEREYWAAMASDYWAEFEAEYWAERKAEHEAWLKTQEPPASPPETER